MAEAETEDFIVASNTDSPEDIRAALEGHAAPEPAPTPETPESAADTATETPEAPDSTDDAHEGGEKPEEGEEPDEEPVPGETPQQRSGRTRSRLQARIDELTRARYTAEGLVQAKEQEIAALREQLAGAKPAQSKDDTAPTGEPTARPADDTGPQVDQYETYEAYLDARADWIADRKVAAAIEARDKAQREAAEAAAREEAIRSYQTRCDEARQRIPDFDAVTLADLPVSPAMESVIVQSEFGADLLYYLGSHPDECRALADAHPAVALRTLGRLEERLDGQRKGASAAPAKPAATPKPSGAPPPINPVRPASSASSVPLDQMDLDSYVAARNAQIKARGGGR